MNANGLKDNYTLIIMDNNKFNLKNVNYCILDGKFYLNDGNEIKKYFKNSTYLRRSLYSFKTYFK